MKVNLGKNSVGQCGDITKDSLSKSKAYLCGVGSLRAKANSVLCAQYGKWMHGRCAGVKRVTKKFFNYVNAKEIMERQWSSGNSKSQHL